MGTIRRRVAAVLCFLDTVAQTPVSGGRLSIQIRQKSPVIRKEDRYVVILKQPGVYSLDIQVSGGGFSPVIAHIDLVGEVAARIQYIYLLPSAGYPFTPRMAVISGTSRARNLYALRMADGGRYRLMENLDAGGNVIKIWGIERFLQGQQLLLCQEERYTLVTLLEVEDQTEHGYRVREQIETSFEKGKTKIYSVIRISTDESGHFCLAYDRIRGKKETIRILGEQISSQGANPGTGVENDLKNDMKIDMEVEIWEGREIEIHVGG